MELVFIFTKIYNNLKSRYDITTILTNFLNIIFKKTFTKLIDEWNLFKTPWP